MTNRRKLSKNRTRVAWEQLTLITREQSEQRAGRPAPKWLKESWVNAIYVVMVSLPVYNSVFGHVTQLLVQRRDAKPVRDWAHMQRIKSQLCGKERIGFEVYPAESGVVDSQNMYHIWVLPPGACLGVSIDGRAACGGDHLRGAACAPYMLDDATKIHGDAL